MSRSDYFKTEIGRQLLAGTVTVGSFPFLYIGGKSGSPSYLLIGILALLCGMLSVPIMTYLEKRKN